MSQRNVFYSYLKQDKWLLCKKHLYKGLSNSCSEDLIDIKNTLPKHQEICRRNFFENIDAVVRRYSVKKVFSEILQNSQEILRHLWCLLLKVSTISAVQVFSPEIISPVVSFSGFFSIHQKNLFSETLRKFVIIFFTALCQQEFTLFIQNAAQIQYSSKFQRAHKSNRNSCGYYFISFEKFPRERLH